MFKVKVPKSVLISERPKERRCKDCPRWKEMCKSVWDDSGELPKVDNCPIWDGRYNIETGLWYYQNEDDIIVETFDDIESKVDRVIKHIHLTDILIDCGYFKTDEDTIVITLDYEHLGRLLLTIEKRKIDIVVFDNMYLYNVLSKLNMMPLYVKTFQFMKKKFKKLQLKSNNKVFFEAYDDIQLDTHIISFINAYSEAIKGILFEIDMQDKCIKLSDIF